MTAHAAFPALAYRLAYRAVASGMTADLGCFYTEEDYGPMSDAEWSALCAEAKRMMPSIVVSDADYRAWFEAASLESAECRDESRALSGWAA